MASTSNRNDGDSEDESEKSQELERRRDHRSENSLAVLCQRFCELYKGHSEPINIDLAAKQLNIQRRRMYEILNIIQSVGLVSRIRASFYRWEGFDKMKSVLHVLKDQGMRRLLTEKATRKTSDARGEHANASAAGVLVDPTTSQTSSSHKKKAVATCLGERFIQIFLCDEFPQPIVLEDVMSVFFSMFGISTNQMSCARRLYDIANVFCSIGLLEKTSSIAKGSRRKKRMYAWKGPTLQVHSETGKTEKRRATGGIFACQSVTKTRKKMRMAATVIPGQEISAQKPPDNLKGEKTTCVEPTHSSSPGCQTQLQESASHLPSNETQDRSASWMGSGVRWSTDSESLETSDAVMSCHSTSQCSDVTDVESPAVVSRCPNQQSLDSTATTSTRFSPSSEDEQVNSSSVSASDSTKEVSQEGAKVKTTCTSTSTNTEATAFGSDVITCSSVDSAMSPIRSRGRSTSYASCLPKAMCYCSGAYSDLTDVESPILLKAQVSHLTKALQDAKDREKELLRRIELQDSQISKLIDLKLSEKKRNSTFVLNTNSPITNFVFSPFPSSASGSSSAANADAHSRLLSSHNSNNSLSMGFGRKARIGPQIVDPAAADDSLLSPIRDIRVIDKENLQATPAPCHLIATAASSLLSLTPSPFTDLSFSSASRSNKSASTMISPALTSVGSDTPGTAATDTSSHGNSSLSCVLLESPSSLARTFDQLSP